MKRNLLTILLAIVCLFATFGCNSVNPLLIGKTNVVSKEVNYEKAGYDIGVMLYYAYCYLKEDPKNEDICKKLESAWQRIGDTNDQPTVAALSELALDAIEQATLKKYGPLEAFAARMASAAAFQILSDIAADKLDEEKANLILAGAKAGVTDGMAKYKPTVRPVESKPKENKPKDETATEGAQVVTETPVVKPADPADPEAGWDPAMSMKTPVENPDVFQCSTGNCTLEKLHLNPSIDYQRQIADKLLKEYCAKDKDGKLVIDDNTKNLLYFKSRAIRLKAAGSVIMDVMISKIVIKNKLLESIDFICYTNQKPIDEQLADYTANLAKINEDLKKADEGSDEWELLELSRRRNEQAIAELQIMKEQGVDPTIYYETCIPCMWDVQGVDESVGAFTL